MFNEIMCENLFQTNFQGITSEYFSRFDKTRCVKIFLIQTGEDHGNGIKSNQVAILSYYSGPVTA
jgi:hypothetical protein